MIVLAGMIPARSEVRGSIAEVRIRGLLLQSDLSPLTFLARLASCGTDPKNGNGSEPDIAVGGPSLYLVATPSATLKTSPCAPCAVLKEVDLIACEDTRQTLKLLSHYGIKTRLVSYHEHNEMTKAAELVVDLEGGAKIALVTDAGMPGISDPGFRLIALAIRHHVPVIPIPGACAFLAALVASGLPTDSFRFSGFLPSKSGQRRKLLESVKILRERRCSTKLRTGCWRLWRMWWKFWETTGTWWSPAR